jgi:C4-dicarboxylate-specific signal transduction histidine kinase
MKPILRPFLSLSLRTHLILLTLLLALPALALIIYSGFEQRRIALDDGILENKMLVSSILSEQYSLTGDAEELVNLLALLPIVRQRDVAAVDALLARTLETNHKYTNIVISDGRGEVWASGLPAAGRVSTRGDALFQKALRTRRFCSGEYAVGKISGRPNLGFAFPVLGSRGEISDVISVSINFDYLNLLLMASGLPRGSQFTMVDRNGVIIYRNLDPDQAAGTSLNPGVFRRMANAPDRVTFLDFGATESKLINSFGALRLKGEQSPYLYVLAGIPTEEPLSRARRAQLVQVALLSPFLLAALTLAVLIGKFCFVNPIGRLQAASERVARGELGIRVSDTTGGWELRALARSFDDMAQRLALRESQLNTLNQSLELKVEQETSRRLEQERLLARHARLAAIGEMISAIAHQWRQPLATLGATIQSIRMAWERQLLDGPFLERAEADAQKQLYYMSETIEDFRNFFSPEKVAECFEVREKIGEVALLVSAQFASAGVRLEVVDPPAAKGLAISGYQNEFKQSVLNLVSNAFDAVVARHGAGTPPDGSAGVVVLSLAREGDSVVIEVRDNGGGIPAEYADRVYEPYFTSKPEGKGTGIGLYMSKLIVEESMGGRLGFTSSPEGTVFRIQLAQSGTGEGVAHG